MKNEGVNPLNIQIIYEDNHLLIVEKPVNIPVQEDSSGDKSLLTLLKEDLKVRYQKPGNVYLGLVHRLDRPVGGIIAFAKTSKAASRLSNLIRKNEFERKYLAIVRGIPAQDQATLEHFLKKDHRKNIVRVVSSKDKDGKKAILDYETIAKTNKLSLLSIKLHTGRSHQIRVQLAAIGCPLFGDQKYGAPLNTPGEQIALWAHTLQFKHPTKDEIINLTSIPPKEFPWVLWENIYETTTNVL